METESNLLGLTSKYTQRRSPVKKKIRTPQRGASSSLPKPPGAFAGSFMAPECFLFYGWSAGAYNAG